MTNAKVVRRMFEGSDNYVVLMRVEKLRYVERNINRVTETLNDK